MGGALRRGALHRHLGRGAKRKRRKSVSGKAEATRVASGETTRGTGAVGDTTWT